VQNKTYRPNEESPVVHEYAGLASTYDKRWASYIAATVRETLKRLDVGPNSRLLDIGCGTGSLLQAISLTHPTVHLTGIDVCEDMLRVAINKQIHRCHFITGQAQRLPFHSQSFDTVVSCNAFHYWRNPEVCLSEIARILKPHGRLVITDWCDDFIACRVCDLFLRLFNRAHFKTYKKDACERLLRNSGYGNIKTERYKIDWLWGMMTAEAHTTSD